MSTITETAEPKTAGRGRKGRAATSNDSKNRLMTEEHKQALAIGREQGRTVRAYLDAIDSYRPKRGRRRTPEAIQARLEAIEAELKETDPLSRLVLIQEQNDLQVELENMNSRVSISELEEAFVGVAKEFSDRRGLSYAAWRAVGVDAGVLKRAGISRAS